jgi:hypothetical protein
MNWGVHYQTDDTVLKSTAVVQAILKSTWLLAIKSTTTARLQSPFARTRHIGRLGGGFF